MNRRFFLTRLLLWLGIPVGGGALGGCEDDVLPPPKTLRWRPLLSEVWQGAQVLLEWEASPSVRSLSLAYSIDGGSRWIELVGGLGAQDLAWTWTVSAPVTDALLLQLQEEVDSGAAQAISLPVAVVATHSIDLAEIERQLAARNIAYHHGSFASLAIFNQVTGYLVLDLACPHTGCEVAFTNNIEGFRCPCHGSSFRANGCLLMGPAQRGLTQYPTQQTAAHLLVATERGSVSC